MLCVAMIDFQRNIVQCEDPETGYSIVYRVSEIELLQYTGMFDCKGNKIFEKDICRYWMDGKWKIGYIVRCQGGFAINVLRFGNDPVNWLFKFQSFIPTPDKGNIMGDQFEVIDNVCMNPDFVEQSKKDYEAKQVAENTRTILVSSDLVNWEEINIDVRLLRDQDKTPLKPGQYVKDKLDGSVVFKVKIKEGIIIGNPVL